jgi:hypothetical protein
MIRNFLMFMALFASVMPSKPRKSASLYPCTGGKIPANMTRKEYLVAFAKGPCNPVMLVPAMLTPKLVIEISDCEKFRKNYPDTFKLCGFTDCVKKPDEKWKHVPEKEYLLWVPRALSPMSIFSPLRRHGWCWAKLIAKEADFSKPIDSFIVENDAFKVKLFGHTPKTRDPTCGEEAVSNLGPFDIQIRLSKAWLIMFQTLKRRGYVNGLTSQAVPYDWGKSYRGNELKKLFPLNLDRLHRLTNKKVVIISQSYGNKNTFYQIHRLPLAERRKKIKAWIALGYASLGATEVQADMIGGSDYFSYLDHRLGVTSGAMTYFGARTTCMHEVAYIDPHTIFRGQKWWDAFLARTDYENGKVPFEKSGFSFLPKVEEECSKKDYLWGARCKLWISNTENTPLIQVQGKPYYTNDTARLYQEQAQDGMAGQWFAHTKDDWYEKLENPGILFIGVVLRHSPTPSSFIYHEDVKKAVKEDRWANRTVIYGPGDGTVSANSLFAGPLKWAWEFDNARSEVTQPVKIVDLCGTYKQRSNPYDSKAANGEQISTKNEFFGTKCHCSEHENTNQCIHAFMNSDLGVMQLLEETSSANEPAYTPDYQKYVDGLTDEYFKDITERCTQLYYPRFESPMSVQEK